MKKIFKVNRKTMVTSRNTSVYPDGSDSGGVSMSGLTWELILVQLVLGKRK